MPIPFAVLFAFAFQDSFDSYTYKAPAGYTVREAKEHRELIRTDEQRKFYCQIVLYRVQASKGSAATDLDNEWKYALLNNLTVTGNQTDQPFPLPQAPESMIRAAETKRTNGGAGLTSLFLLRFTGRYIGVLLNVPNQMAFEACSQDLGTVIRSVQLPSAPAAQAAPAAPAPPPPQASAAAPMRSTIAGKWEFIAASQPTTRYNMFTKQWETNYAAMLNQFRNVWNLTFDAGSHYTKELNGLDINRSQNTRFIEKGTYSVSGDQIRFEPQACQQGRAPRGSAVPLEVCKPAASYIFRYIIGPHPTETSNPTPGLQLSDQPGNWTTYRPVQ